MNPPAPSAFLAVIPRRLSGALALLCVATAVCAGALPEPVKGALPPLPQAEAPRLTVVTARGQQTYSLAQLEGLGLYRVATRTFWPDDDGVYEGPRLADVLRHVGLGGAARVRITARDGFSQVMPREDWARWPVLLATRKNGVGLGTRDKGPLRVIYPRDMSATLSDPVYRLRWVWLVERIEVAP